jgi:hypothetical protein
MKTKTIFSLISSLQKSLKKILKMEFSLSVIFLLTGSILWAQSGKQTYTAPGTAQVQITPETMSANSWLSVTNTPMGAVAPTYGQFPGTWGVGGPSQVIGAWGGAALDTKRSQLILWGGGHADYYGNELYAFDIPTLSWSRITDPFINPVLDQEVNADGTPNSRHTYSGLAYISHADRFFGIGGSLAGIGFAGCNRTWTFDFTTNKWSDRNPVSGPATGFGFNCSYDSTTKKVWLGTITGLWSYDYNQNIWMNHNSDNFYYHTSTMDTKRGTYVVVGNGEVFSYDIANGNYVKNVWSTTGGDRFIANGQIGFDYDPVSDRYVGFSSDSVYALDPVTKTWTAYGPAGAPGVPNGIFGRWRYVPSVNAFILVTSASDDVHFYKFSAGNPLSVSNTDKAINSNITTYPNPFNGIVNIQIPFSFDHKEARLQVVDIQGRVVADLTNSLAANAVEFNANGLSEGMYFVQLKTNEKIFASKIIYSK